MFSLGGWNLLLEHGSTTGNLRREVSEKIPQTAVFDFTIKKPRSGFIFRISVTPGSGSATLEKVGYHATTCGKIS
jgi:hypothetical protein